MTLKDFEILKTLGLGSFASVYKVKRLSDGKEYAMKKVKINRLKQKERENAVNEVRILASINHPNIIGYKEAFYDEDSNCLCIIMEYASGGDLLNLINKYKKNRDMIEEDTIWKYFIQMLQGLNKLHNSQILHRDIKCANVFLTKDHTIKLGDLNVSKIAKGGLVYTQTGTPYYASPEVWKDKPYDAKSDIWSLGCVLYELIALKTPFRAFDMEGLYRKIIKGAYDRIPSCYSSELSNIVGLCLAVSTVKRPTSEQLLNNPIILKKMNQLDGSLSQRRSNAHDAIELLNTIKMPRDLRSLQKKLPKPKYNVDIHKSFDYSEESKNEIVVFNQIRHSINGNLKAPLIRANTSDAQRRQNYSIENKENKPYILSPKLSINPHPIPIPNDEIKQNNKNPKVSELIIKDNKESKIIIIPHKKSNLILPPASIIKSKEEGNFQRASSQILIKEGIDMPIISTIDKDEIVPTPVINNKKKLQGYQLDDENRYIVSNKKKNNIRNKIILPGNILNISESPSPSIPTKSTDAKPILRQQQ